MEEPPDGARAELIRGLLLESMIQDDVASIDAPHIVICRAARLGTWYYSGPYPSGLEAISAATQEANGLTPADGLEFSVAPLGPVLAAPHVQPDGGVGSDPADDLFS